MTTEITQKMLHSLVHYDPETGIFTWLRRPETSRYVKSWNTRYAGRVITSLQIGMTIDGEEKKYEIHRLAWLYVYGVFPTQIDHENRIKTDNRISNLRPSTTSYNGHNVGLTSRNNSGVRGVNWHKASNKWIARICTAGKVTYLGTFENLMDAEAAYSAASIEYAHQFSIHYPETSSREARS